MEGKLQEMQENERKRVRLMAEKKEARAKQMEQMRRAIEKRQAENARQLKRIDHDRKAAFDHKQRVTLERQRRMAMDEAMQAEQKRKLTELQERKRLAVVEESAREEELRIHGMLAKFSTMDVNLNHVTAQKNRQCVIPHTSSWSPSHLFLISSTSFILAFLFVYATYCHAAGRESRKRGTNILPSPALPLSPLPLSPLLPVDAH